MDQETLSLNKQWTLYHKENGLRRRDYSFSKFLAEKESLAAAGSKEFSNADGVAAGDLGLKNMLDPAIPQTQLSLNNNVKSVNSSVGQPLPITTDKSRIFGLPKYALYIPAALLLAAITYLIVKRIKK